MIELAPDHKLGLPLDCPVMLAAGSIGYGEARHRQMEPDRFGAVVVGPFTRRSRAGNQPPRLAETVGGFVRRVSLQNRGVSAAVRKFAHLWPRIGCPVVAQIADSEPTEAAATVRRLSAADGIEGFELLCLPQASEAQIAKLLEVLLWESDLPVLVKLPLARAAALAPVTVTAGAVGVVVGSPPTGAAVRPDGQTLTGETFGPGVFPAMLAALLEVKALNLPASLIACGGIHTREQARHALAAGADALQLDSLVWIEPAAATALATELAGGPQAHSGDGG
jgi:dihydroorotate dehydrogenase (NAD+) catalytic subunit